MQIDRKHYQIIFDPVAKGAVILLSIWSRTTGCQMRMAKPNKNPGQRTGIEV